MGYAEVDVEIEVTADATELIELIELETAEAAAEAAADVEAATPGVGVGAPSTGGISLVTMLWGLTDTGPWALTDAAKAALMMAMRDGERILNVW